MQGTEMYHRLLDEQIKCEDLRIIVNNYNTKEKRSKLGCFLIENKDKIYDVIKYTNSHEIQVLLMKIISKTLTKKQITQVQFFKGLSRKCVEKDLHRFLVEFNFLFNHRIVGCEFTSFLCKEKNVSLSNGAVFIDIDSLKLYAIKNIVILYDTSIINCNIDITLDQYKIIIRAKDNKNVEIVLEKTECVLVFISKLKEKYMNKIVGVESLDLNTIAHENNLTNENSQEDLRKVKSVLSQEKKVSFSLDKNEQFQFKPMVEIPEIKEQEIKTVKEEIKEDTQTIQLSSSLSDTETSTVATISTLSNSDEVIKPKVRKKRRSIRYIPKKKVKTTKIFSNDLKTEVSEWYKMYLQETERKYKEMKKSAKHQRNLMLSLLKTKRNLKTI